MHKCINDTYLMVTDTVITIRTTTTTSKREATETTYCRQRKHIQDGWWQTVMIRLSTPFILQLQPYSRNLDSTIQHWTAEKS